MFGKRMSFRLAGVVGGGSPLKSPDVVGFTRWAGVLPPAASDGASLNEFVAFLALEVLPPDVVVLIPPTAHQVTTDKDIGAAGIAGNIVASADIEQSNGVAATAFDIAETLTQVKIASESLGPTAAVLKDQPETLICLLGMS